jgi:hypothetical protein
MDTKLGKYQMDKLTLKGEINSWWEEFQKNIQWFYKST